MNAPPLPTELCTDRKKNERLINVCSLLQRRVQMRPENDRKRSKTEEAMTAGG